MRHREMSEEASWEPSPHQGKISAGRRRGDVPAERLLRQWELEIVKWERWQALPLTSSLFLPQPFPGNPCFLLRRGLCSAGREQAMLEQQPSPAAWPGGSPDVQVRVGVKSC